MSTTVRNVLAAIDELWPLSGAESWDAVGLVTGDHDAPVTRISLAVDAVFETVDEAIAGGADLLIAHHPLLLRGVTSIASDTYKGAILAAMVRANCALVAAHTNADVVAAGTSGSFAAQLGLTDVVPLVAGASADSGIGRTGMLPQAMTLGQLARVLAEILPATATGIRVAGGYDQLVRSVALCGGAGDAYLNDPAVRAADVYITSDLRHHPASEARERARLGRGPALIDVSHWASEWLWLESASVQLRALLPEVTVTVSELRTDPWDFAVVQ
ncbi:MAG: Nif3-like dinuclear metal center hexameric protein [Rhodoglobus sp.]